MAVLLLTLDRMAIVVPKPLNNGLPLLALSPNNFDIINGFQTPCWAPLEPKTSRLASSMDKSDEQGDWATGILGNKSMNDQNSRSRSHNIVGIKSPKPVGIVTFEDIIGAILQKPTHADVDFSYGSENGIAKSDVPAIGATIVGRENFSHTPSSGPGFDTIPLYIRKGDKNKRRSVSGGLRKRIVSSKEKALPTPDGAEDESTRLQKDTVRGSSSQNNPLRFNETTSSRATFTNNPYLSLDGVADDRSSGRFDVHQDVISHTARNGTDHSSYTQNSQGGFHGVLPSEATLHNASGLAPESLKSQILAEMGGNPSIDDPQSSQGRVEPGMKDSLPSQKPPAQVKSAMVTAPWAKRYVSAEAPVILPFKRESYSSFDRIEQSFRHKLNPSAPTFLVTSPSGHDHSAADVDTIYTGCSIRTAPGAWHGRGRNGNASIRSSYHENKPRLVDSIIASESSELFDAHVAIESSWPSDVITYSETYNGQNPHLSRGQAYEYESCSGDYSEIPDFPAPPDTFDGDPNSHLFDGPVLTPEPYDAIPVELLENMANKENRNQIQMSKTLPRMRGKKSGSSTRSTLMRESSFHDDRALLPSQRRAAERSASSNDPVMGGEVRRSSIWF
ncbi:hypothetical protein B0O99DRAFT_395113 [Bisporella sp. PMI_857]|nr:hypothetical protein B0O99DRAFT_395113 [Bisporella sp. PMI_857]